MVVSIGAVSSAAQGVSYFERDGYYTKDDAAHLEASAWAGKGAEALGLHGPVDPGLFRDVLEGAVPDGSGRRLGRIGKDGGIVHRPGRDLTFSAPKSVSLVALLGNDERISSHAALRMGLVSEVVERDALWARAHELAAKIAAKPPAATQGTVRAVWESLDLPRTAALNMGMSYTIIGNPVGTAQVDRDAVMGVKKKKFEVR